MITPIAVGIAILFAPTAVDAQSIAPNVLPFPTGPFPIGRVTYHWIDSSRPEFLDIAAPRRRELLVDVWYPARSALREHAGAYLPELTRLQTILTDSVLQREFAPAYSAMVAGQLSTHAKEGAPAKCPSSGCPLLIFSHGGGVDRSFYCSQYEDFASHGYIVAAIAHTYDTHLVVFPDGRVVGAAPTFRDTLSLDSSLPVWRRELARELRSQAHLRRVIEVEARDILFVIDEMDRYAGDARLRAPFLHQVDFQRVGALGHSAGGEAAARACQLEPRIGACLNQDGVMQNLPFARDSTGRKMNQPFMYIGRRFSPLPLSDAQLAAMQLTRAEADSLFRAIANGQQSLLSDMPGGAYRITLKFPGIGHMSFSDEPLIEAAGDSVKRAAASLALTSIQAYTRAFFDKTLFGHARTLLDRPARDTIAVTVERFAPGPPSSARARMGLTSRHKRTGPARLTRPLKPTSSRSFRFAR